MQNAQKPGKRRKVLAGVAVAAILAAGAGGWVLLSPVTPRRAPGSISPRAASACCGRCRRTASAKAAWSRSAPAAASIPAAAPCAS